MSQPENEFVNTTPNDNEAVSSPSYGMPPPQPHQDVPAEPARMNWLQRWFGVLLSPGETFADVNRKPTILAPILIMVIITAAATSVMQWKLAPYMPELLRTQIKSNLERFGQTPNDEQLQQAVDQQLKFQKFTPIFIAVFAPVTFLILAGIFALGMLLIQAKATFKKIYSVTLWTFAGIAVLSNAVFVASMLIKDDEGLRSTNLNNPTDTVPTNFGVFLGPDTSPMIKSLAGSIDLFSIWAIVLLAIGFAAIANSRNIKTSKTATMILVLWGIYVIAKVGISSFMG